ncbi:DMT family transporter [Ancylobacter sp.]|uniref:DMT family transporter n=1 Tax=Ancylobacter sp. TaxID=1872567 RepID=UPI003BAC53AA
MLSLFNRLISPTNAHAFWIGILFMVLGNFLFALNDTMGKILVGTFAVSQVLAIRSVGAFLVLGPMLWAGRSIGRVDRPWLQLVRVGVATGDTALFYAAVAYLPLAEVFTFYMAGPIYVAAMSSFLPGGGVGWRRWLAILAGFGGVVIALGPSVAVYSPGILYALAGSFCYAGALMMNKVLVKTSDTSLATLQALGALIGGGMFAIFQWTPPSAMDIGLLLLLGVVACLAHLMISRSVKLTPVSVLAPFQYSLLLWGVGFGLVVFGDVPNERTLLGAAIITMAGLFLLYSESRSRRRMRVDALIKDFP